MTTTEGKTVTLAQVLGRKRINPKIARRRLRNAGVEKTIDGYLFHPTQLGWVLEVVRG